MEVKASAQSFAVHRHGLRSPLSQIVDGREQMVLNRDEPRKVAGSIATKRGFEVWGGEKDSEPAFDGYGSLSCFAALVYFRRGRKFEERMHRPLAESLRSSVARFRSLQTFATSSSDRS